MSSITHEMEVSDVWWVLILNGLKTVEGRKNSPKWSKIKVDDYIKMTNGDKHFIVKVIKINKYLSFRSEDESKNDVLWDNPLLAYLENEGLNNTLPGIVTYEEGMRIYLQWSTISEIKKYGFLGIHIEVIE